MLKTLLLNNKDDTITDRTKKNELKVVRQRELLLLIIFSSHFKVALSDQIKRNAYTQLDSRKKVIAF